MAVEQDEEERQHLIKVAKSRAAKHWPINRYCPECKVLDCEPYADARRFLELNTAAPDPIVEPAALAEPPR